ncbi:MAG: hypothetical protein WC607_04675 [Candidatus Micrarchaeia archaeon]
MASKKFPFILFDALLPRPLIPVDFPKSSLYCLIDSGASFSFMSADIMRHEEIGFSRESKSESAEGICGKPEPCIDILGTTPKIALKIDGLSKEIKVAFKVMGTRHNLPSPILGLNFFEQVMVGFGKDKDNLFTILKEY